MLKKKYIYNILILLLYISACLIIYQDNNKELDTKTEKNKPINNVITNITKVYNNQENSIATIEIPKINLKEDIFKISNSQDDVDKNVIILENSTFPVEKESILFIAAHSGNGNNAYFNDIDRLSTGDKVNFYYKNELYTYYVEKSWETEKNGYIEVSKSSKHELILTTCSKNSNKQLIIKCIKKE